MKGCNKDVVAVCDVKIMDQKMTNGKVVWMCDKHRNDTLHFFATEERKIDLEKLIKITKAI